MLGMPRYARQDKRGVARQDRWGGKGLLRGESHSGHPEGAKAPEGSPTILRGCLANARQGKKREKRSERSLGAYEPREDKKESAPREDMVEIVTPKIVRCLTWRFSALLRMRKGKVEKRGGPPPST
jgi:hypothetical protein